MQRVEAQLVLGLLAAALSLLAEQCWADGGGPSLTERVIWAVNAGGEAHIDVHGIHFRKDPLEGKVGKGEWMLSAANIRWNRHFQKEPELASVCAAANRASALRGSAPRREEEAGDGAAEGLWGILAFTCSQVQFGGRGHDCRLKHWERKYC